MDSMEDIKIQILIDGYKRRIVENCDFIKRVLEHKYPNTYDTHEKQLKEVTNSLEENSLILKELLTLIER